MPGICCMCTQRPNLQKTANPCKLRCHSFCAAAYVPTLSCCSESLPVYISVLFLTALHLSELCIVQPMVSEVSATTLSTYLFCLICSCVLQEVCTVAHLRLQNTTFAIIALHLFQRWHPAVCCCSSKPAHPILHTQPPMRWGKCLPST